MRFFYSVLFCFVLQIVSFSQSVDPFKFIATLKFDDSYHDFFTRKEEQVFPISFLFNKTQDGNGDGTIDVEDACENIVPYAIGGIIYGTSKTVLDSRGPNDQRPVIYFHFVKCANYDVYEYWLYYAYNDYLNDHEHDWEKYFVYVKDGTPISVRISRHRSFKVYPWDQFPKDDDHIIIGVNGGSHAMSKKDQKGVKIRYNGEVTKNAGKLFFGDGVTFPWKVFGIDSKVIKVESYVQSPDNFFNGDPLYRHYKIFSKSKEYEDASKAPWNRKEWDNPPCN